MVLFVFGFYLCSFSFRCVLCIYWWEGFVFFFKEKTSYEMRISDWSSDVCSSDLAPDGTLLHHIEFPVSNVTKIALGGPDLKTAYATTAAKIGSASCRERVCQYV